MAEEDLPDSFEPGSTVRPGDPHPVELPDGDVRVASWTALVSGILVLVWYLHILVLGGVAFYDFNSPLQIAVWVLAVISFVAGVLALNARRERELAAAGFIAGTVAILITITIGLPTGLQILL